MHTDGGKSADRQPLGLNRILLQSSSIAELDSATDSGRFFYQKSNSNWWKLYDRPGKFVGYIYFDRLRKNVLPEYY